MRRHKVTRLKKAILATRLAIKQQRRLDKQPKKVKQATDSGFVTENSSDDEDANEENLNLEVEDDNIYHSENSIFGDIKLIE